jgi:Ca-activated chloride channel family protein
VPVVLLEWRAARRADRALERLVGSRPGHALLSQRLPGQRRTGTLLRTLAAAALAIGAAGPEWGHELVRKSAMGSDVVLVMDVSASMDVRDVPPSRLEEARREALAVLDHLQGSKVGVVAFAGDAVRLCPLTLDRSAARLVLESLSSSSVSLPGTHLGRGLRVAARLLPARRRSEQAIVVWTDGEDLEQTARGAIDELARAGHRVFAVGVGTPAGDIVPVLDDQGRAVDVKRDEGGAVRSRLDEDLLRALARGTRGGYFSASRPGGELPRLVATLGSLAHGGRGERLVERSVPRFPWFAAGAAALLAAERVRRRRRGGDVKTRQRSAALGAAAAFLALAAPHQAKAESAWARGDRALREERWAAAESLYAMRARSGGPPEVQVNLAIARARLGKQAEAEEGLRHHAARDGRMGRTAGYDLGTLLAERSAYDEALKELRRSLERDPNDEDARFNYEWVLRHQRQPRSEKQSPPKPRPEPRPQGGNPGPSSGAPSPQGAVPPPPPSTPRSGQGISRQQAEQLLGSLQELERLEQRRQHQVRVMRERRGKDW